MPSTEHRIIGGLFGLEPMFMARSNKGSPFTGITLDYFLNARCAIYATCESVKPSIAWLPSYLCGTVLDPFRELGVAVRYYDAGPNFKDSTERWVAEVEPGDLVIVIHYFGFANRTVPADRLKRRGAIIVEDASQALFITQQYPETVCIIYSPRKFLGVPDGGLMVSSQVDAIHRQMLAPPPAHWWRNAFAMTQMRREFDLVGGENQWFSLYREVEETFPLGRYRSSDLTKVLIETGTDYQAIRTARRANYLALSDHLKEFALFPDLDRETVPLGFPVCVDATQRDAVLKDLYKQQIYPMVHWRTEGVVPEEHRESHLLSQRILTLICDQRYTVSDMLRQADVFLSAVNSRAALEGSP
jgi:hypothetical protein